MHISGIVGKKIVHIDKYEMYNHGQRISNVLSIELEDGTLLVPRVHETEDLDYAVDFQVIKPKKAKNNA